MDAPEVIALAVGGVLLAALTCWFAVAVATRVVRRRHGGASD